VSNSKQDLLCRRCDRPVFVYRDDYDVFEGMHYVCFHYEFEHDPVDPDEDCEVPGCPSAPAARQKDRLAAAVRRLRSGSEELSASAYLDAFAAWLGDCEAYYASRGTHLPWSAWQVVADGMRAALGSGAGQSTEDT
jgi:hypothetical protein